MLDKRLYSGLLLTALGGIIFCILGLTIEVAFTSILAFPFEQIGLGLRWLSLSSTLGNIFAIILYILSNPPLQSLSSL